MSIKVNRQMNNKTNKKPVRLVGALMAVILVAGLLVGCTSDNGEKTDVDQHDTATVKIGYLPITHSLPLITAYDKYWQDSDFEVELVRFSAWPDLTEAFHSGRIDGAITMFELAMVGKQNGHPYEILSLSHREGDVLVTDNDIDKVEDLKGERFAIPHRLSGHNILLYEALKDAGLSYNDVDQVEMAPPEMASALARKEIAGYVVAEPFGAQSVINGHGQALLRAQDIIEGWICCGLVMNPGFSDKYPGVTGEIVEDMQRAGEFIDENHEEAIDIAENYFQIERQYWELSLEWISYSDLKLQTKEFQALKDTLKDIPWDGERESLFSGELDLDELLAERFLK